MKDEPKVAHSKSEYKRLTAQGAKVAAPRPSTAAALSAPSQEDAGQGEVAGAAPLPEPQRYSCGDEELIEDKDGERVKWSAYETLRARFEELQQRLLGEKRLSDASIMLAAQWRERAEKAEAEVALLKAAVQDALWMQDVDWAEQHAAAIKMSEEKP